MTFTALGVIPLSTTGRYTVEVQVDETPGQILTFYVKLADSASTGDVS